MGISQLVASIIAGLLVNVIFPGGVGPANTTLSDYVSPARGLFMELFFTAQLVLVVLLLATEKRAARGLIPFGVGLALFVIVVAGKSPQGGTEAAFSHSSQAVGADFREQGPASPGDRRTPCAASVVRSPA